MPCGCTGRGEVALSVKVSPQRTYGAAIGLLRTPAGCSISHGGVLAATAGQLLTAPWQLSYNLAVYAHHGWSGWHTASLTWLLPALLP